MAAGLRAGAIAVMSFGLALAVAGCGVGAGSPDASGATSGPIATVGQPSIGPASAATRDALFAALGRARLIVADSVIPYRPAEVAQLAAAPRRVYEVSLPAEDEPGFIVVYEFDRESDAIDAAKAQYDYLASGPGKVQAPLGTEHVLQQLGPTLIYYHWLPRAARDPSTARIADALETVGTSFGIQN